MVKNVVNFSVKASFVTNDAKEAKTVAKNLKIALAASGANASEGIKLVVKEIKAAV